jgi:hypothetical protein
MKINAFFRCNSSLSRSVMEIGLISNLIYIESVELIIQAFLEFSYNYYKVDVEHLDKENSNLRREL